MPTPTKIRLLCTTLALLLLPACSSQESATPAAAAPTAGEVPLVPRDALFGAIYPAFATKGDERPERDVYALYVRTEKWKYIYFLQDVVQQRNGDYFRIQSIETDYPARKAGDEDLYDLEDDPYEQNNLAGDPAQKKRLAQLREQVLTWWRATGGKPLTVREK